MEEQNVETQNTEVQSNTVQKNQANKGKNKKQAAANSPEKPNDGDYIPVTNNTFGKLVYKSKRTGDIVVWHEYGDVEDMEFRELRSMKSNNPRFFKDGWIKIDHEGAIKALRLDKNGFMTVTMSDEDLEWLFGDEIHIDEFESIVKGANQANKQLIVGMARDKVSNGEFDARRKIQILEEVLNVNLDA